MACTTALAERLNDALPQTQCTRCGFPDCSAYAQAIAAGQADLNQCPPGGRQGIERLAAIAGRPTLALNPLNGSETPRKLAVIDEAWCIGCTLCLKACPVDCIVGGPKLMHTVINDACTGCELCIPACPVDCIAMVSVTAERTGWDAWSAAQAAESRLRYAFHRLRTARDTTEHDARLASKASRLTHPAGPLSPNASTEPNNKRAVIDAAVARARAKNSR